MITRLMRRKTTWCVVAALAALVATMPFARAQAPARDVSRFRRP